MGLKRLGFGGLEEEAGGDPTDRFDFTVGAGTEAGTDGAAGVVPADLERVIRIKGAEVCFLRALVLDKITTSSGSS